LPGQPPGARRHKRLAAAQALEVARAGRRDTITGVRRKRRSGTAARAPLVRQRVVEQVGLPPACCGANSRTGLRARRGLERQARRLGPSAARRTTSRCAAASSSVRPGPEVTVALIAAGAARRVRLDLDTVPKSGRALTTRVARHRLRAVGARLHPHGALGSPPASPGGGAAHATCSFRPPQCRRPILRPAP